jgi:hypothetical protein
MEREGYSETSADFDMTTWREKLKESTVILFTGDL